MSGNDHDTGSKHRMFAGEDQKQPLALVVPSYQQTNLPIVAFAGPDRTEQLLHSWNAKEIRLDQVSSKVTNGDSIYIGSTAATADATLQAIVEDPMLQNIQIIQMLPGGILPHLRQSVDRFRTVSFYSFAQKSFFKLGAESGGEGLQDYKPVSIQTIPHLLETNKLHVDVAIIKVGKPHKGFVSLGMGVEFTLSFLQHAKLVIAEVNEHMVWTDGHSKIPLHSIDWWVSRDEPLLTTFELWPQLTKQPWYEQEILSKIGENVLREIPDRSTLRFGVSPTANAVLPFLDQRKDLGLHTDVLNDAMFQLHEKGVFTNAYKTIDTGRTIVSQAHGSQALYEFLDRNPCLEFRSMSYVCDPQVLARIDNLIVIVGALKVDLTGQVATDSIAHKFYGGVWSDDDSIRGAKFSRGGKPIVVVPSKSLHGRSNIVFALPPGTGVSITRADVEYVVTEYGIAYLYGKSIRERCSGVDWNRPSAIPGVALARRKAKSLRVGITARSIRGGIVSGESGVFSHHNQWTRCTGSADQDD